MSANADALRDGKVTAAELDVWATPESERFLTPATIITFIRTIACVSRERDLPANSAAMS